MCNNHGNFARSVDSVHTFDGETIAVSNIEIFPGAVFRICEIDASLFINCQVIRLIKWLAVIDFGQNRQRAVEFETNYSAFGRLAADQSPLPIKKQSVGSEVLFVDALFSILIAIHMAETSEESKVRMIRRALTRSFGR